MPRALTERNQALSADRNTLRDGLRLQVRHQSRDLALHHIRDHRPQFDDLRLRHDLEVGWRSEVAPLIGVRPTPFAVLEPHAVSCLAYEQHLREVEDHRLGEAVWIVAGRKSPPLYV